MAPFSAALTRQTRTQMYVSGLGSLASPLRLVYRLRPVTCQLSLSWWEGAANQTDGEP